VFVGLSFRVGWPLVGQIKRLGAMALPSSITWFLARHNGAEKQAYKRQKKG